jgi:hypothetical protein
MRVGHPDVLLAALRVSLPEPLDRHGVARFCTGGLLRAAGAAQSLVAGGAVAMVRVFVGRAVADVEDVCRRGSHRGGGPTRARACDPLNGPPAKRRRARQHPGGGGASKRRTTDAHPAGGVVVALLHHLLEVHVALRVDFDLRGIVRAEHKRCWPKFAISDTRLKVDKGGAPTPHYSPAGLSEGRSTLPELAHLVFVRRFSRLELLAEVLAVRHPLVLCP